MGYGRALPGSFGFGNGIKPDGVDDYMIVQPLLGSPMPTSFTIEFWTYHDTSYQNAYCLGIQDTINNRAVNAKMFGASRQQRFDTNGGIGNNFFWDSTDDGKKSHVLLAVDNAANRFEMFVDGLSVFLADKSSSNVTVDMPVVISKFELFRYVPSSGFYSNYLMDEIRFYSVALRNDQILLNYNNRVGANPCETEHLLFWYKFEEFEMLDFSSLQDGSDMRLGIRDLSGKNNHSQQFNMDTNPTSGTYVLKSF